MNEREFVAFDLETTGLSPTLCQIVEIGAVRFTADGTEVDRMEQLLPQVRQLPPKIRDFKKIFGRFST